MAAPCFCLVELMCACLFGISYTALLSIPLFDESGEEKCNNGPMATPSPYQRKIAVWASAAICLTSVVLFAWIGLWYMIPFFVIFGAVSLWRAFRRPP